MKFQRTVLLDEITPDTTSNLKSGQYIKLSYSGQTGRFIGITLKGFVRVIWTKQGSVKRLLKTMNHFREMSKRHNKPFQLSLPF